MDRRWKLGLLAALVWSVPHVADACSAVGLEPHTPDSSLTDDQPPAVVGEVDVSISRGKAPDCRLGTCSSSSCDGVGFVTLVFDPPTDDQSSDLDMGYEIEVIEGEAPQGLFPDGAVMALRNSSAFDLTFEWADGATDDQEALDFTIVLRAVDAAGNVGPDSEPIVIADPGGKAGCNVGHQEPPLALLLLPLFGFAVTRRRR